MLPHRSHVSWPQPTQFLDSLEHGDVGNDKVFGAVVISQERPEKIVQKWIFFTCRIPLAKVVDSKIVSFLYECLNILPDWSK